MAMTKRAAPTCVLLHVGVSLAAVSVTGPFGKKYVVRRSKGHSRVRFKVSGPGGLAGG